MDIVAKDLDNNAYCVTIDEKATGADLKREISRATGSTVGSVSFEAAPVENHHKLSDLGIRDGANVLISNVFLGGF